MLTKEELFKLSKVSKIFLKEEESEKFLADLNDILKFVDMINNFDF